MHDYLSFGDIWAMLLNCCTVSLSVYESVLVSYLLIPSRMICYRGDVG